MGALLAFPAARAANPSIARLRCDACGAAPMIFVPDGPLLLAFCGPGCAATCGLQPWASTGLAARSFWRDRAELEDGV